MTNYVTKLALLVALGAGVALAQAYPQQQEQKPSEPTAPQTQEKQPAPEQTQPQEQEKMPQAETAPSTTDVQSNIQAALQKEPTLANSNIQVNVTNKAVELSGTVSSAEEKKTAEQIAKSNAAGRKVKSHLKVSSAAPGAPPK
jgi:osmotically-inducible protein OsmY